MNFATARPRRTPDLWVAPTSASKVATNATSVATPAGKPTSPSEAPTSANNGSKVATKANEAATEHQATKKKPKDDVFQVPLPSAEQLEAMDLEQLNVTQRAMAIRLGKTKARRSRLLAAPEKDEARIHHANADIAELGAILYVTNARISALRRAARHARGEAPGLAEAVLMACESKLREPLFSVVMTYAEQIVASFERDVRGEGPVEQPPAAAGSK